MAIVSNYGVEVSADTADLIDELLIYYCNNGKWPRSYHDSKLLHNALYHKLVVDCTSGDIAVLLKGYLISSWWPVLYTEIFGYWSKIKSALNQRNRSASIEYEVQAYNSNNIAELLIDIVQRHHWYGSELYIKSSRRIIVTSIPTYIDRLNSINKLEEIITMIPEISEVYDRHHTNSDTIIRSHEQIRHLEQKCLRSMIERELAITISAPFNAPVWLRRTISDYIDEADISLRGGAPFAAAVVYTAAIEACLTSKYSRISLPPNTPATITHEDLYKLFKMSSLIDAMSQDVSHDPVMLKNLRFARRVRNGIHGNMYSECYSSVGVGDALIVRKALRDLAEWLNIT